MAFQMEVNKTVPFQSAPLVYPNAYWVAKFGNINKVSGSATIVFDAYADQAARESGKTSPVATHEFIVTGAAFERYFSTAASTLTNLYAQAYAMAKVTPDPQQHGFRGRSFSPPVPVVFFATATDV